MEKRNGCAAFVVAAERHSLVLSALIGLSFAWFAPPTIAQQWIEPDEGSWFDPLNWNAGVVPVPGASVTVNNGGTAVLDAGSDGVSEIGPLFTLNVGRAPGSAGTFSGSLSSTGVDISTQSLFLGSAAVALGSSAVSGWLTSDSAVSLAGPVEAGQLFQAASGSTAEGVLHAGALNGQVSQWLIVGNVTGGSDDLTVGNRSSGEVHAATGELTLLPFTNVFIGSTLSIDRSADGTRVNEATGIVDLGGKLIANQAGALLVGRTTSGVADGALRVGTLENASFNEIQIATAGIQGQATGNVEVGNGDLAASSLWVGFTSNGEANGSLALLGGRLTGNNVLSVGRAGGADHMSIARGNVSASDGFDGFTRYEVGVLVNNAAEGSIAEGVLTGSGAIGASRPSTVLVGYMNSAQGNGTANGSMSTAGALDVTGALEVGQIFQSGSGSKASGALQAGSLSGEVSQWLIVGNVTGGSDDLTVGNRSSGELRASTGELTLLPFTNVFIGSTLGVDRSADGARVNEATGIVELGGKLIAEAAGALLVGRTDGGVADGSLRVGTLEMNGIFNSVQIGTAGRQGHAAGTVEIDDGDLAALSNISVGVATNGHAEGSLALLGGRLTGNNVLSVGRAGGAEHMSIARGTVSASDGFDGFTRYEVGVLVNNAAEGSIAEGVLTGSGAIGASRPSTVLVGYMNSAQGNGIANGSMSTAGALDVTGALEVGQIFQSGSGSKASGALQAGSLSGEVSQWLIVGNVTGGSDDLTVGNRSSGELRASTGELTLLPFTNVFIGSTLGIDRSADGARVNEATGIVELGGKLIAEAAGALLVGRTDGGVADGSLRVGTLETTGARFNSVQIGAAGSEGQARGFVQIDGGTLATQSLFVGNSSGGTAEGRLVLNDSKLEAQQVVAGNGTGSAAIELNRSEATIDTDFRLGTGMLSLESSLLTVGDEFLLGSDSLLNIGIAGFMRGSEYGAIDTHHAFLDGLLRVDFAGLTPLGGLMTFDVLFASSGSIFGDFAAVQFNGLWGGYTAYGSIEDDRYRVYVTTVDVPEPPVLALLFAALTLLALRRRRAVL